MRTIKPNEQGSFYVHFVLHVCSKPLILYHFQIYDCVTSGSNWASISTKSASWSNWNRNARRWSVHVCSLHSGRRNATQSIFTSLRRTKRERNPHARTWVFFFFFFCTYVQFFRFCDHGISRRVEKYFFSFEHSKGKIAYRPRIWSLRLIYDWYTGRSKCSFAAVKVYQGQWRTTETFKQ